MADDALGHAADLDQRVEIDAGADAHLLAEQHVFLGADIARRALRPREGAAAEAAHRAVELRHAEAQAGMRVRDREAAGVVQVQRDAQMRPARAHRADAALDPDRRRPAHGVRERDVGDRGAAFPGDGEAIGDGLHDRLRRDIALVVAAEGGHHADPRHRDAGRLVRPRLLAHGVQVLGMAAVEVLAAEGVRRAEADRADHAQPILERQRAVQAILVEPERGIVDAGLRPEAAGDRLGIRPARDEPRIDEAADLDVVEPGLGQRLDQRDLVGGGDRAGLDLEALARAFLEDVDAVRQVGHGRCLRGWRLEQIAGGRNRPEA